MRQDGWNNGEWPNAPSGKKQLGLWRTAKSKAEVAAFFREQAARRSWPGLCFQLSGMISPFSMAGARSARRFTVLPSMQASDKWKKVCTTSAGAGAGEQPEKPPRGRRRTPA